MTSKNKYYKFLQVNLNWLATLNGFNKLPAPLQRIVEKHLLILRTRGTKEAIRYNKDLRASLFRILSLNSSTRFVPGQLVVHKDLRFLLNGKEYSVPYIKLLITTLYCSRILKTPAEPNLDTIQRPSEIKRYPFDRTDFKLFWRHLGYTSKNRPRKSLDFRRYHKTSKSGPNGQALWSSFTDFLTLLHRYPSLLIDICIMGGKKLSKYLRLLSRCSDSISQFFSSKPGSIRKLIIFPDKEGKTREVAILDYFSQTSLIPLHNYLFRALKKIPQDYTFDQLNYMTSLEGSEVFYSIDLTAFTDRFPIRVNRDLLEPMIGPDRTNSWSNIMTQEGFEYNGDFIHYRTGNPMGAYSSWNSTTLSHHFVVWKACQNKNINWKTLNYAMLGDDLVIGNPIIAKEYCRLIRTLGVSWSKEKTHVSPHFFEFAKRIHWCGHDMSPFPMASLWSCKSKVALIQTLDNAAGKGWFSKIEDALEGLLEYYSRWGYPRRLRTKWVSFIEKAWIVISILQKKSSALELIPFVEKISPVVASKLNEEKINNILINSIMLSFVDSNSNIVDTKKHKDTLGQVAEDITIFLTSPILSQYSSVTNYLPESLPHTHVWGIISEDYLRVQREAYIIDTIRGGDWDPLLKNLKIPTSDKSVYLHRKTDLLYLHSMNILDKFEDSIKQLNEYPQLI